MFNLHLRSTLVYLKNYPKFFLLNINWFNHQLIIFSLFYWMLFGRILYFYIL